MGVASQPPLAIAAVERAICNGVQPVEPAPWLDSRGNSCQLRSTSSLSVSSFQRDPLAGQRSPPHASSIPVGCRSPAAGPGLETGLRRRQLQVSGKKESLLLLNWPLQRRMHDAAVTTVIGIVTGRQKQKELGGEES